MFLKLLRIVGAVVAAIVVAMVLLIAVELFSAIVHPFPPDFAGTEAAICEHVARYPQWVLAAIVPMWAATAWVSTWLAGWLGGRGPAMGVAVLLMAAVLCNLSMLPYPLWFKIVQPIAIVIALVYAYSLSTPRSLNATQQAATIEGGIKDSERTD
ncbi:hypothetical protein [Botrimarina mediterranea]|uniref:hypothetical protein n=1 Tax=Botrimarina mediterranea TaxID=2528022 RepID=UPI00118BFA67|nr:hypothetical protein K2D_10270 [Planctomycetes bacterium K2D]